MGYPEQISLVEIDEWAEVCGNRVVDPDEPVFTRVDPPENVFQYQLNIGNSFLHVTKVGIGWFHHEEEIEYELSNKSRFYLMVELLLRDVSENQSNKSWSIFRNSGIDHLISLLGFSSWGIGRRIQDRRGQDVYGIELEGLDGPCWHLHFTLEKDATYGACWELAEKIDGFAAATLIPLIKGDADE